ncbi:MAG: 4Fe-4S binding protein, partial [Vulcanimicrobiota bacterium]
MKIKALRKLKIAVQVIAAIAINSAFGFFKTKQVYGGPEKKICLPVLNCHACPTARTTCPIGAIQHNIAHHN